MNPNLVGNMFNFGDKPEAKPQTIREQVTEFMRAKGQEIQPSPKVPSDKIVRLRCRLVFEEAMEMLHACDFFCGCEVRNAVHVLQKKLDSEWEPQVDLVEVADALADVDYVVEGARLAFGINGQPIADEVHRTNMAKIGGGTDKYGKGLKPEGWKPPDIESLLNAQMKQEETE